MKHPFFNFKRFIAITVALCMVLTDRSAVSYAQAASAQFASEAQAVNTKLASAQFVLPGFNLPSELGFIEEVYSAPREKEQPSPSALSPQPSVLPSKTVIYIQDAHDSLEAQEHIAEMIRLFVHDNGIKTVLEEGYDGKVPTDEYFGSIKDPEIKEEVSYFLMDKLRIGGAEYTHINRQEDFKLIGADSIELHRENVKAYQKNSVYLKQVQKDLKEMFERIERMANVHFSKELKQWMKNKKRYDAGQLDLLSYLKRTAGLLGDSALPYPNILVLLSAEETKNARAIEKAKEIHSAQLFEEIGEFENSVAEKFLTHDRDRDIFKYYKALSLMLRLSDIEVTPEEYEAAKGTLKNFDTRRMAEFIVADTKHTAVLSTEWEDKIKNAIRFYEIAHQRDDSIEKHLEDFLASDQQTAVLVFGGFHRDKIQAIMRAKGISFVTLQPAISSVSQTHQEYYKQLMSSGYLDFEKTLHLDSEQGFSGSNIPLPQASRMSRTLLVWDVPGYGRVVEGLAETARVLKNRKPDMDRPLLLRQMARGLQARSSAFEQETVPGHAELRNQEASPQNEPPESSVRLRMDEPQGFAAPRIRGHLQAYERRLRAQALRRKLAELGLLFTAVALAVTAVIWSVVDAETEIRATDVIWMTIGAFAASVWVLYRFLSERDFRISSEQERINFERILNGTKDGESVIRSVEMLEAYAQSPDRSQRSDIIRSAERVKDEILERNPLLTIVDQEKITEGDKIVIFEIPGTGHEGLGIKEMNALFGELLTDNFLAEVKKSLYAMVRASASVRGISITPLYSTHKEHAFVVRGDVSQDFLRNEIQKKLVEAMNRILLTSDDLPYRRIIEEKKLDQNGEDLFEIHFGMSRVEEDSEEGRLTANIRAKQALLISRYRNVWDNNRDPDLVLYSHENYAAVVDELASIRRRLLANEGAALFATGENEAFGQYFFLRPGAANILRKKVEWGELSTEEKKVFHHVEIYQLAQRYFELLNLQDVIKKWQMDEAEAFREIREIRGILETLDFLVDLLVSGAQGRVRPEEMPLDVIGQQRLGLLRKYALNDARNRKAYSQNVFHAKAAEMANPVIVGLDVIGMGPMNYEAFDGELQQIDKQLKSGNPVTDAEVQAIQRQAADSVTLRRDHILDEIRDQLQETYREVNLTPPGELIARIGGDEVVFVGDSSVLHGAVLDRFLTGLRERIRSNLGIHVRIAADSLIQDYRRRFTRTTRSDPKMMAHARALSLQDTNVNHVLKPMEKKGLTGELHGHGGAIVVRAKRWGLNRWNRVVETDQGTTRIDAEAEIILSNWHFNPGLLTTRRTELRSSANDSEVYPQPVEFFTHPWTLQERWPFAPSALLRFPGQLTALKRSVFPALLKRQGDSKKLKMSFLATNTGEEIAGYLYALSLAYDAHTEWGQAGKLDLSIVANDLHADILEEAQRRLSGKSPFVFNGDFIGGDQEAEMTIYEPLLRPLPSSFEPFLRAINPIKSRIQKSFSFISGSMFRSFRLFKAIVGSDIIVLNAAPIPSWKPLLWLFGKILTRGERPPVIITTNRQLAEGLSGYQVLGLRDLGWAGSYLAIPKWLQEDFDIEPLTSMILNRAELRAASDQTLRQQLLGELHSEPDAQNPVLQTLFMFDALKRVVQGEPSARNPVFQLRSDDILKAILGNRKAIEVFENPVTQENLKRLEGLPYLYRLAVNGIATEPEHYGRLFIRAGESRLAPEESFRQALEMGLKTVSSGTPQEIRDEKLKKVKRFLDYHFLKVFLRYWNREYAPSLPTMLEGVIPDTVKRNQMLMANITHLSGAVLQAVYDVNHEYLSAQYGEPDSTGSIVLAGANARGEYPTFDYDAVVLYEKDGRTPGGPSGTLSHAEFYNRLAVLIRQSFEGDPQSGYAGMGREMDSRYQYTIFKSFLNAWGVEENRPMWAVSINRAEAALKSSQPVGLILSFLDLMPGAGDMDLAERFIQSTQEYLADEKHLYTGMAQTLSAYQFMRQKTAETSPVLDIKGTAGGLRSFHYFLWFLRLYRRLLFMRAGQPRAAQKPASGLNFLDNLTVLEREFSGTSVRNELTAYYLYLINLRLTMDLFYARNSKQLPTDSLALAYFAFYNATLYRLAEGASPLGFDPAQALPLQEEFLRQLKQVMTRIDGLIDGLMNDLLSGNFDQVNMHLSQWQSSPELIDAADLRQTAASLVETSREELDQAAQKHVEQLVEDRTGLSPQKMIIFVTAFLMRTRNMTQVAAERSALWYSENRPREFERMAHKEEKHRKAELRNDTETLAGVRGEIERWDVNYIVKKKHFGLQLGRRLNMASGPGSVLEFDFLKRMMRLMLPEAEGISAATPPGGTMPDYVRSQEEFEQMLDVLEQTGILKEPVIPRGEFETESQRLMRANKTLAENFDFFSRNHLHDMTLTDDRNPLVRDYKTRIPEHYLQSERAFQTVIPLVLLMYERRFPGEVETQTLKDLDDHFVLQKKKTLHFDWERGFFEGESEVVALKPSEGAAVQFFAVHPELTFKAFEYGVPDVNILEGLRLNRDAFEKWIHLQRASPSGVGSAGFQVLVQSFVHLLGKASGDQHAFSKTIWYLHRFGLLNAYIREYEPGKIGNLIADPAVHEFTTDQHSLYHFEVLDKIGPDDPAAFSLIRDFYLKIENSPEDSHERKLLAALRLSVFLHDSAKSFFFAGSADHAIQAAQNAVPRYLKEMGFDDETIETTAWVVRNHMVLNSYAYRRLVDHPEEISDAVERMVWDPGITPERLRLLYLISLSDYFSLQPLKDYPSLNPHFELGLRVLPDAESEGKWTSLERMHQLYQALASIVGETDPVSREDNMARIRALRTNEMQSFWNRFFAETASQVLEHLTEDALYERYLAAARKGTGEVRENEIRRNAAYTVEHLYQDYFSEILDDGARTPEIQAEVQRRASSEFAQLFYRGYIQSFDEGYLKNLTLQEHLRRYLFTVHLDVLRKRGYKKPIILFNPGFDNVSERQHEFIIGLTTDERGVFEDVTGVLALHEVDVQGARFVRTGSGLIVDRIFGFRRNGDAEIDTLRQRIWTDLGRIFTDYNRQDHAVEIFYREKEKPYQSVRPPTRLKQDTHIQWFHDRNTDGEETSVFTVKTTDRPALLHVIGRILNTRGYSVIKAPITTYEPFTDNTFYINKDGTFLSDAEKEALEKLLVSILDQPIINIADIKGDRSSALSPDQVPPSAANDAASGHSELRITMHSDEAEVAAWMDELAAEITDAGDRKAAEAFITVFRQNPELDRSEISYEGWHQFVGVSRDDAGTSYAHILLDAAVHFPRKLIRAALVHEGTHILNKDLQDAQLAAFLAAQQEWAAMTARGGAQTQDDVDVLLEPLADSMALTMEDEWRAYQAGDRVFLSSLDGSVDDFIQALPQPDAHAPRVDQARYLMIRGLVEDIRVRSTQLETYELKTKATALQGILSIDNLLALNQGSRAELINLFLIIVATNGEGARYVTWDQSREYLHQTTITDIQGLTRWLLSQPRAQQIGQLIAHYTRTESRAYLSDSDFVTHEAIEESGYGQELRRKFTSAFDRIMAASVPAASQDLHTGIKAVLYTAYDKAPQIFLSIDPNMEARAAHVIYLSSERQLILKFPSVEKAREADENFLIGAILYAAGVPRTGHPWNIWTFNPRIRDNTYNIPAAGVTYRVTNDLLNSLQQVIAQNIPSAAVGTSASPAPRRRWQFRRVAPNERVDVPPRQRSGSPLPAAVPPRESPDEIEEIRFVNFRGNENWQQNAEKVIREAFRAIARTPTESLSDQRLQGVLQFIHEMMEIRGTSSHVVLAVEPNLTGVAGEVASLGRLPAFFRIMLDRDGQNNGQKRFARGPRGNLFDQKVFIMHLRKWQVLASADGTPANDVQIYDGINVRQSIATRPGEQIIKFDRDFLIKAMVHSLLDQQHSYPWIMAEKYPQIQFNSDTNAIVLPGTRRVFVPTPSEIVQIVEHIIQFANLHPELRVSNAEELIAYARDHRAAPAENVTDLANKIVRLGLGFSATTRDDQTISVTRYAPSYLSFELTVAEFNAGIAVDDTIPVALNAQSFAPVVIPLMQHIAGQMDAGQIPDFTQFFALEQRFSDARGWQEVAQKIKDIVTTGKVERITSPKNNEIFIEMLRVLNHDWLIDHNMVMVRVTGAPADRNGQDAVSAAETLRVAEVIDKRVRKLAGRNVPVLVVNRVFAQNEMQPLGYNTSLDLQGMVILNQPRLNTVALAPGTWRSSIAPQMISHPYGQALRKIYTGHRKRYAERAPYFLLFQRERALEEYRHAIDHFRIEDSMDRRFFTIRTDYLDEFEKIAIQPEGILKGILSDQSLISKAGKPKYHFQNAFFELQGQIARGDHAEDPTFLLASWLQRLASPVTASSHHYDAAYYGLYLAIYYDFITQSGSESLNQRPLLGEFLTWQQTLMPQLSQQLTQFVNDPERFRQALKTIHKYEFTGSLEDLGEDVRVPEPNASEPSSAANDAASGRAPDADASVLPSAANDAASGRAEQRFQEMMTDFVALVREKDLIRSEPEEGKYQFEERGAGGFRLWSVRENGDWAGSETSNQVTELIFDQLENVLTLKVTGGVDGDIAYEFRPDGARFYADHNKTGEFIALDAKNPIVNFGVDELNRIYLIYSDGLMNEFFAKEGQSPLGIYPSILGGGFSLQDVNTATRFTSPDSLVKVSFLHEPSQDRDWGDEIFVIADVSFDEETFPNAESRSEYQQLFKAHDFLSATIKNLELDILGAPISQIHIRKINDELNYQISRVTLTNMTGKQASFILKRGFSSTLKDEQGLDAYQKKKDGLVDPDFRGFPLIGDSRQISGGAYHFWSVEDWGDQQPDNERGFDYFFRLFREGWEPHIEQSFELDRLRVVEKDGHRHIVLSDYNYFRQERQKTRLFATRLIQGLILNNHQAGADVLLTLGAVASRYLKKELIQEVFDSYRTGESPVPPEHLPAIGDLNEVMQDAPTADLLDASAAAPETPLPVLPHPVAVIKSALEELEREFPRIQELRQEFVRLKTFFEDVEPGQDDFSVLQVFRLAALADRWDAFWDNHIRYQIGRPQDFGADSGNFVRHELMTGTRHEWGFGVRNLVARLTEQSIRDPLNNLVSNQLKRLSTDLLSHVQEVQTVGEAYGLFLARESLGKVPEVRFQDADGVSVNFFSGIGYLKAKKRFDLPVGSVAYDEAQNLITFTLPKSELRIAPPADASVPPSAANDVASAYSRVTAPESRATSDEFRRIEVNYELFDTDAEGTITMPVAAFAEIAQQTVSADEDLKAEALAKMDALAVAANRWHNVQLILYAEGSEYDAQTNYYLEQFRPLGNVTITPQKLEEALSVPRGKEHHTPVDISPEGRIQDHDYVGGELVKKLKFVKLRKNPGDILFGLLASITGGDLPGVVTGEDGNLDDLTGYATSQAQAYLARQVVAWSA